MYVAEAEHEAVPSVRNALHLLDGYLANELKNEMPVHIYSGGIELAGIEEDLDYKHTSVKTDAELPLGVFQAAPPRGGLVHMNIQAQSETQISLVFSGATYNLRQKFESGGAAGGYTNPEGKTPEEKGPYLRIMKDVDVSSEDKLRVHHLLTDCLSDLCMRVTVDGDEELDEDSATASFIKELRTKSNLYFFSAAQ